MNRRSTILLAALAAIGSSLLAISENKDLKQEAVAIVKQFAGKLKPELKQALENGGPVHAVEVCSEKAPAIAAELAEKSGWKIRRVSLKPRNPAAAPDAWERASLEALATRQANNDGSDPLVLVERGDTSFRFMKAQVVEPLCLTCHGQEIEPDIAQALEHFYPKDRGTGYSLGDVRGAISLQKDY